MRGGREWESNPPRTASRPLPDLKSGRPTRDASLPIAALSIIYITFTRGTKRGRRFVWTQIGPMLFRSCSCDRLRDGTKYAGRVGVGLLRSLDVNRILAATHGRERQHQAALSECSGDRGYGNLRSPTWPPFLESPSQIALALRPFQRRHLQRSAPPHLRRDCLLVVSCVRTVAARQALKATWI
jgi:hypothetical protein